MKNVKDQVNKLKELVIIALILNSQRNIKKWTIEAKTKVTPYEKPYPNFDKDHKKWINQTKQKYFI